MYAGIKASSFQVDVCLKININTNVSLRIVYFVYNKNMCIMDFYYFFKGCCATGKVEEEDIKLKLNLLNFRMFLRINLMHALNIVST